jgi:preprotein translocase subunit YajC
MKKYIHFIFCLPAFLLSLPLMAQDENLPPPDDKGLWQTMIMIAIALLFFYFILWRPEQTRRKALESQRSSLKKGDRVTAMGIVGTVLRVQEKEQTVILKMYDGSKIEVLKGAITDVIAGSEEDAKRAEKEEGKISKKMENGEIE